MSLLDLIREPNDIKSIEKEDYAELAAEIRAFLIAHVSKKGGHLASNLGAVELTMALHLAMEFPEDKLIFDVGHQAYTHKLLTGRKEEFLHLREMDGMSGFPKRAESDCDAFDTGHSSTSISAAMGYAVARDLRGSEERIACVIGDGSMTGGEAYEAINSLAQVKSGCVIVLNDNEMSINKNVGGLSKYLNSFRVSSAYNDLKSGVENSLLATRTGEKVARTIKRSKDNIKQFLVPGSFFEELGITYVGPIDGHDIQQMVSTFRKAFKLNKPILIHVKTKKGKGYRHAERHPDYFHGIAPFDVDTGKILTAKKHHTYTDIFGKHLVTLAEKDERIVAITAAMAIGTGLNRFESEFPERFFDVGIAEQHAVTYAAGLACSGYVPVVAVYSSFLQRAYDQILHDVALQKLHVIFAVDRSGIVGRDGETHQGIYDTSYLTHIPGMTVLAPKNRYELMDMMDYALSLTGPVAIKYPRGDAYKGLSEASAPIEAGKSEVVKHGSDVCFFVCGHMMEEVMKVYDRMESEDSAPTVVNVRFLNSVDTDLARELARDHHTFVTVEENIRRGGYGEYFTAELYRAGILRDGLRVENIAIEEPIVKQGEIGELRRKLGLDSESIYQRVSHER